MGFSFYPATTNPRHPAARDHAVATGYLLVPEQKVMGARQNAETVAPGRIAGESIESFVSQNLEELSAFSSEQLAAQFRQLLETYHRRVDEAQEDKSLMVDIPPNLRGEA